MTMKLDLKKPRVSIGMPVFNGEKFIEIAIKSIINQTFTNFELIISDNASTDQTQAICLEYASKDTRIHYYRNKKNIGGPKNYNIVFELSSGEYFKWAAYDDVLAPDFLKKCVTLLDKDSSIVGCHSRTGRIDQYGNFLGYHNEDFLRRLGSRKLHERFHDLLDMYYITTPFHGLYRSNLFAHSQLHGSYIGADRNLVAELSLMGRIYIIPETLFFWREHPNSYTSLFYGRGRENITDRLRKEIAWWSKTSGPYFPHWKNFIEYFRSVNRIPLKLSDRILCYLQILDWLLRQGRRFLAKDIMIFLLHNSRFASALIRNTRSIINKRVKSKIHYYLIDLD